MFSRNNARSFEEKLQIAQTFEPESAWDEITHGPISGPFFYRFGVPPNLFYSKKQYRTCHERFAAEWQRMEFGFAHWRSASNYLFDFVPGYKNDELILCKSAFQIQDWKPFAHIGRNSAAEFLTQGDVSNCRSAGIDVFMYPVLLWGFVFVGRDQLYVGSFAHEKFEVSERERNYWDLYAPDLVRPEVVSSGVFPHSDGLVTDLISDDYYENPIVDGLTYTFKNILPDTFHGDWDGITSAEIHSASPSPHITQLKIGDWQFYNYRPDFSEVFYFSSMSVIERAVWWEQHKHYYA